MKIEKIKPIPKYIERIIKAKDKKNYQNPTGVTRYYAYLTKNDGELGNHNELVELGGTYAGLYKLQFRDDVNK